MKHGRPHHSSRAHRHPGELFVDETPTLTAEGIAIYTMSGRVTGIT